MHQTKKRLSPSVDRKSKPKYWLLVIVVILIGLLIQSVRTGLSEQNISQAQQSDSTPQITEEAVTDTRSPEEIAQMMLNGKITELQDAILDDLSLNCETKGIKEPDGAIILDVNGQMSIGRYMYQIKTVQLFVKHFHQRDISRAEAIAIAIDPVQSTELTRKILFEYENGARNWYNCTNKLNLNQQINLINKLAE